MDLISGIDIADLINRYGYIGLVAGGPLTATLLIRFVTGRNRTAHHLILFASLWLVVKLFVLPYAGPIESLMASLSSSLRHHGI